MSSNRRKQLITAYVIRRMDKKDPKDTNLIFGAPGPMNETYPHGKVFVTSSLEQATKYAREMVHLWGMDNFYNVETREVRV